MRTWGSRRQMMKKLDWLFNIPIAHRGLHNDKFAENSMSAFKAAIDKGFNIEIDVHLSSDGEVIVFHDFDLKRICGIDIPTSSVNSTDLKKYRLLNTDDTIPTLKELLQLIDGKVGLLVEIKYKSIKGKNRISPKVYELIKDYKGDVAIQSFSPTVVKWFRINADEIPRGMLATAYENMKFSNIVRKTLRALNRLLGDKVMKMTMPDFIAYNILSFPSPTMKRFRASGIPFLTWTVNKMEHLPIAKEWADNIIFEKLDITEFK